MLTRSTLKEPRRCDLLLTNLLKRRAKTSSKRVSLTATLFFSNNIETNWLNFQRGPQSDDSRRDHQYSSQTLARMEGSTAFR